VLETLCWIARLGSFTAAAERLNTTQPAISKRVKELEEAIGILPAPRIEERLASKQLRLLSPELPAQRLEFVVAHHRDQNQQVIQRIVEEAQLASSFVAR